MKKPRQTPKTINQAADHTEAKLALQVRPSNGATLGQR